LHKIYFHIGDCTEFNVGNVYKQVVKLNKFKGTYGYKVHN